jgi:Fur family transcriptional regulator, ferric uptake regulator
LTPVIMASILSDADSAWAEHAREVLDRAGHRRARAREALIALLARQECALSPLEIEDRLRRGERPVARASIYRILELLADHGLVARLELGDGIARYEQVDPAGGHHHHLLCDSCGKLLPFDDRDLERSIDRLARRLEFDSRGHEVVLHGACSACQS